MVRSEILSQTAGCLRLPSLVHDKAHHFCNPVSLRARILRLVNPNSHVHRFRNPALHAHLQAMERTFDHTLAHL